MPRTESDKPEGLPATTDWADETIAWFEAWRDSPRTDEWDAVQWQFFYDTAVVHSAVYGFNDLSQLPELSKRLQFMGLTFEQTAGTRKEDKKVTTLAIIQGRRADRVARAEDKGRTA